MGYVTMGIFTMTHQGVQGGIFQMLSHGIVSGALFLCVGVIYDRMHTRDIAAYGGLVNRMPKYAVAFLIFTMANVGLPGTSGFVGEILVLMGTFQVNTWVAFFATSGVILSACYALYLYRRVVFGALEKESLKSILDLDLREKVILVPMIILTIFFGFYPMAILDVTQGAVDNLINHYTAALDAAAGWNPACSISFSALRFRGRDRAMSDMTQLPDLMPVMPEIILALGAMVLLMIGAFGGKNVSYAVFGGAMGLLGGTFLVLLLTPNFGRNIWRIFRTG